MWQAKDMMHVINSPIEASQSDIPIVPLAEYMLLKVEENLAKWRTKPWMVDVNSGTSVTFGDAFEKSKNVANALAKLGFKQGDVLYFVTFEMAQIYVVDLAVWILGGALRGCYQRELPEVYTRQIIESKARIVLVDADTTAMIKTAIGSVDWDVQLISVGLTKVEDAISYEDLCLEEDSSALPEFIEIDPKEDVVLIPNTSGSTGAPKGVVHTHFSAVAQSEMLEIINYFPHEKSAMALMTNYAIGNFSLVILTLRRGVTLYNISKFSMETYFDLILQYEPHGLIFYPFVASWFAKSRQLQALDLSFIKQIYIGAWVLDTATADLLHQKLPHANLHQLYGMTEAMIISATDLTAERDTEQAGPLPVVENEGELHVSSGQLMPFVKAQVVDIDSGDPVPNGSRGEILIKSPAIMKGYLQDGELQKIDPNCWLRTGDLGFFDEDDNIYIIERLSFMFKYTSIFVSPAEIESVLSEHQDVQSVGVVGIPDPEVTTLARAFVVLRPGRQCTEDELCAFVAERMPEYKHLHGGVRFIEQLPVNRGGKLDRGQLKVKALEEN